MSLDDDTFKLILEKTNNIKFVVGLEVLSKHYKKIIRDHGWHIQVNIKNNIVFEHIVNNYNFKNLKILLITYLGVAWIVNTVVFGTKLLFIETPF